jgi:oligoribonuclease (3'-5' exoribonuclease)
MLPELNKADSITVKDIITLTEKVTVCATQYMAMNTDMKELKEEFKTGNKGLKEAFRDSNEQLKSEIKESIRLLKNELENQDKRICTLEMAKGKKLEKVFELVYRTLLTGFIGFLGILILDYFTKNGG